MGKRKSWVWSYAKREGDRAYCDLCTDVRNEFSCAGGTTGSLLRHLRKVHHVEPDESILVKRFKAEYQSESTQLSNESEEVNPAHEPNTVLLIPGDDAALAEDFTPSSSDDENHVKSTKCKKGRPAYKKSCSDKAAVRECDRERTELIHQALATLIATNGLPVSFCSSPGFGRFMAVVEPDYELCREEAVRARLNSLKSTVEEKIKQELKNVNDVVCTVRGCRSSSTAGELVVSLTAHIVDDQWSPKSFTLAALEMPEHRPAVNLPEKITEVWDGWEINGKITAVVVDDENDLLETVRRLTSTAVRGNVTTEESVDATTEIVTCAVHGLREAVDAALREKSFSELIDRCSVLVDRFDHSDCRWPLVQYRKTRWNSIHSMLDSVLINKQSISTVLEDKTADVPSSSSSCVARKKLEFTEAHWSKVNTLVNLLTPLNVVTNVLSRENGSPVSMVRPLLAQLLDKHLKPLDTDDKNVKCFKRTVIAEIKDRFRLDGNDTGPVCVEQIASFLDPRYKDLEFESVPAAENIRSFVQNESAKIYHGTRRGPEEPSLKSAETCDLDFLFGNSATGVNDLTEQFQTYVAEPQLRYDLNPYEWWKSREHRYPALAAMAKKFFAIPASSASHDRCFSAAGNTVTSTNDVDSMIFLYQNRKLLPE